MRPRTLGLIGAGGIAAVAVVGVLAIAFRPSPPPDQTAPPSQRPIESAAIAGDDGLPKPDTSYVVLLVQDPTALDTREVQWIGDLRRAYDRAEVLGYRDATAEALSAYLTIFVIGESPEVDTGALAAAYGNGASIHLIGAASAYRAAIVGAAQ
jgi:hypothetical protein